MTQHDPEETFHAFKNSFSYGSRSDLNFKFLKRLSDQEAGQFFQELLWRLGEAIDDGDFERIVGHLSQAQTHAYRGPSQFVYDDGPFSPLAGPLTQTRLTLFTSSGHFVAGDDPRPFEVENMSQQEAEARVDDFLRAEPRLSIIPMDTPPEKLRVRHGGYDIRGALADPNITFPLARLRELHRDGRIGLPAPNVYSFMGACSQLRLLNDTGPAWVQQLITEGVEGVLMVPV
jgi:hypothetical protein